MKFELEDYHGNITDEELIGDLKRVALGLEKNSVTRAQYDKYGKFHSDTLRRRFGSWSNVLDKAGLDFSNALKLLYPNRRRNPDVSNGALLKDLKDVAIKLNKDTVYRIEYKEHGKYGTSIFDHRFGSWLKALEKAGLNRTRNRGLTDEELLKDLKDVAIKLKKNSVTIEEYHKHGKFFVSTYYRRFGSWSMVLEKAGLEKTRNYGITDEELFLNLEEVWIKVGRQPHYNDVQKPFSKYSKAVYISRFGTWRKVLKHFIEHINKGEAPAVAEKPILEFPLKVSNEQKDKQVKINTTSKKPVRIIGPKTTRSISYRLKFIVMRRDNFACRHCGWSPAKRPDPKLELQIDHIIPYPKGETVLENLQTLCSTCNIGKSNLEI